MFVVAPSILATLTKTNWLACSSRKPSAVTVLMRTAGQPNTGARKPVAVRLNTAAGKMGPMSIGQQAPKQTGQVEPSIELVEPSIGRGVPAFESVLMRKMEALTIPALSLRGRQF